MSQSCKVCEKSFNEVDKLKVDVAVLTDFARGLADEKKAHKIICDISKNCSHISSCPSKCYYNDKQFVPAETDSNESDSDESDVNESDSYESDLDENNDHEEVSTNNLMCEKCSFCAKSHGGLTKHRKVEHEIQREECEVKTTTKVLLKKQKADKHK